MIYFASNFYGRICWVCREFRPLFDFHVSFDLGCLQDRVCMRCTGKIKMALANREKIRMMRLRGDFDRGAKGLC